jgi:hypothetical protein
LQQATTSWPITISPPSSSSRSASGYAVMNLRPRKRAVSATGRASSGVSARL